MASDQKIKGVVKTVAPDAPSLAQRVLSRAMADPRSLALKLVLGEAIGERSAERRSPTHRADRSR